MNYAGNITPACGAPKASQERSDVHHALVARTLRFAEHETGDARCLLFGTMTERQMAQCMFCQLWTRNV